MCHSCRGLQVGREGQAEQSIAIRKERCAGEVISDHSIYDCLEEQVNECVPYATAAHRISGEDSKAQWWVLPKRCTWERGNITCTEMQTTFNSHHKAAGSPREVRKKRHRCELPLRHHVKGTMCFHFEVKVGVKVAQAVCLTMNAFNCTIQRTLQSFSKAQVSLSFQAKQLHCSWTLGAISIMARQPQVHMFQFIACLAHLCLRY